MKTERFGTHLFTFEETFASSHGCVDVVIAIRGGREGAARARLRAKVLRHLCEELAAVAPLLSAAEKAELREALDGRRSGRMMTTP